MDHYTFCDKPIKTMAVAAHFDDVEFMAYSAIVESLNSDNGFCAVVATDGSGSARSGKFADITDRQMVDIRAKEQIKAAQLGRYSRLDMLMYPSADIKKHNPQFEKSVADLILELKPTTVYTHNLFDKHPTHIAVSKAVVSAIRQLQFDNRPQSLIGCEVWRGLDFVCDQQKIAMDTSFDEEFAKNLFGTFESQIQGGKRYDKAVIGRWLANATFFESHIVDKKPKIAFAIDMTPLIKFDDMSFAEYVNMHIDMFRQQVLDNLN